MWKRILNFLKRLFGGNEEKEINVDVDIGETVPPVDNTICQVIECEIIDIEEIDDEQDSSESVEETSLLEYEEYTI